MEITEDGTERFVNEVMHRAGWTSPEAARAGIRHSLRVIGEALDDRACAFIGEALPARLREDLEVAGSRAAPRDSDEIFARVARSEHVPLGRGLEHAQAVFQVTGETIGDARRARISAVLGEDIGHLFDPRVEPPAPPPVNRATGRTLATGRPGSETPLSTADPAPLRAMATSRGPSEAPLSTADPSRPHGDTVAEANPRREHKLSSGSPD